MASLTTIYWRDIPAQVQCKSGRQRHSVPLGDRFQVAIDRAAMLAGSIGSDEYLDDWRRVSRECGDDLEAEAAAEAERLEKEYPQDRLLALVDSSGHEADGGAG